MFFQYFPGVEAARNSSRREIQCTGESLIKQAVGCLATAAALVKGVFESEKEAVSYVTRVVTEKVSTLFHRTRKRVVELGIVRGVEVPNAVDWHLDPRYAQNTSGELPPDFRVIFDEDLQLERFRNHAVAGCPF